MSISLTDVQIRVMGCLMEKSLSTPDYYPLSLNALTNACNQKSSRDPVVSYDEMAVQAAVDQLKTKELVNRSDVSRVPKFEELLSQQHNLLPRETSVLCVLLLRGPQTVGELRTRTSRLCQFDTINEVTETLTNLEELGLVRRLSRQAGHKESRYIHLLCAEPLTPESAMASATDGPPAGLDVRVESLEQEVAAMRGELAVLNEAFETFKKQFE